MQQTLWEEMAKLTVFMASVLVSGLAMSLFGPPRLVLRGAAPTLQPTNVSFSLGSQGLLHGNIATLTSAMVISPTNSSTS